MNHRNLRIAWSVAWGIVAVLLVALWVRSYWTYDVFGVSAPSSAELSIHSSGGYVGVFRSTNFRWDQYDLTWTYIGRPSNSGELNMPSPWLPYYAQDTSYSSLNMPNWLIVLSIVFYAAAPWVSLFPWSTRFSLRALLIATTLVAVGLGLIVWLAR